MAVDMQKVGEWLRQADVIYQTPLVRMAVVPLLKAMLPPLGVTPEQIAVLDQHYHELTAREAEAKRRAGTSLDA